MIVNQLPQTARYIPCSAQFVATFNAPIVGMFSFNPATNSNKSLFKTLPTSWYLIESITWAASVAGQDYSAALQATPPQLKLTTKKRNIALFGASRELSIYEVNGGYMTWHKSDQRNDEVLGTVSGQLNMTPALIGVTSINVTVSLNVYAIEATQFDAIMRNGLSSNAGQIQRGAL